MLYFVLCTFRGKRQEKVDEFFYEDSVCDLMGTILLFEYIRIFLSYYPSYSGIPPLCAYLHFEQDRIHLCNVHGVLTAASWLQICGCISAVHTMNFTVKLDFLQIDWPLANKAWNTQLYLNVNKWGWYVFFLNILIYSFIVFILCVYLLIKYSHVCSSIVQSIYTQIHYNKFPKWFIEF